MENKTMLNQLTRFTAVLLTGLIAGTFFYGTLTVIPTFYEVSPNIHLSFRTALMRHNPIVVMSLVILAIAVIGLYTWQVKYIKTVRTLCFIALILTITSLVITRLGSVPINMVIKTWHPDSPPVDWLETLKTWDFYNLIRTFTSIGSFLCLLIADWVLIKQSSKTI